MPLVTDSRGVKFGKSEGNALWLDKNKTSSYELYQFFVNVEDSMVIDYLKIYTFLSKEEIEEYEKKNNEAPHLREAHKKLAEEIITFLHGHEEYEKAVHISESLFSGNIKDLTKEELLDASKNMDSYELKDSKNLVDLLTESGICSSKREAREFISNNSISVNGDKINDLEYVVSRENALFNEFTIIRKGKKKYFVIKHI
jgi:tyrosyl-tRNA synthetase